LCIPKGGGRYDDGGYDEIVQGLLALAFWRDWWLRPVESWWPEGGSLHNRFASLARHLLAAFPMPPFMTNVWFAGQNARARRHQGWYIHLGSGKNIRKAEIPLSLTKLMAHHFVLAPDHFAVEAALRWGQVRGFGGSKELARAVANTRLAMPIQGEDFWLTVIQFLVNHSEINLGLIGPIVDYLYFERFEPEEFFDEARGAFIRHPRQPNLSMKGRTANSLIRQLREWRESIGLRGKRPGLRFNRSGLETFRRTEAGPAAIGWRVWTIRELLTSAELRAEGIAMHHCVKSYAYRCLLGMSSIWSMTVEDESGRRRVLTIDVDPARWTIVDARRSCNDFPKPKDREILELWAKEQRLTVKC
jgi:hypothetical protein